MYFQIKYPNIDFQEILVELGIINFLSFDLTIKRINSKLG